MSEKWMDTMGDFAIVTARGMGEMANNLNKVAKHIKALNVWLTCLTVWAIYITIKVYA
jgi:predicted membrane protein